MAVALAGVPLVFLLLMLAAPVVHLMFYGWQQTTDWSISVLWEPWLDPYLRWRMVWSFAQAALTCVFSLVLGLPLAWVLARYEFTGRRLLVRSLMLPFVVPTLVAALGILALWGRDAQGSPWLLLYGNLFFNVCVVTRPTLDALERVSATQVAAARTLGASAWRAFWRIEWPSIQPSVLASLCLVFLYCFSGFGLALVLGGHAYATVEVEIYTLVAHELALPQASVLSLWVMALTSAVVLAYAVLVRRMAHATPTVGLPRRRLQGWRTRCAVVVAVLAWMLICAAPLVVIAGKAIVLLVHAGPLLREEETLSALGNTVLFTGLTVLLSTGLGLLHGLAAQRSLPMRVLAFSPFIVSPVLVGFGLLLLYPGWSGGLVTLVAAYSLLAYPFVAKSVIVALDRMPANYVAVARTLGASPWRAFWRVTLPLLHGALRRGAAFAAATAVGEFAVTLFLARPEWATLTTLIYQYLGRPGQTNLDNALVLAFILLVLALLAFMVLDTATSDGVGDVHA